MRYPRLILCDNMEDKGIERSRAHNFQKVLIREAEKHKSENYQMIYTTSHYPPGLDDEKYAIGEYYTKASRTLKNIPIE